MTTLWPPLRRRSLEEDQPGPQALFKIYGIGHCYRYGGDEFLVLRDFTDADTVAEKTGSSGKNWNMPGSWIFT
ncbi:hypothetical protein ACXO20_07540 [Lactobacillus delbrueckii subsp. bulgaricus]